MAIVQHLQTEFGKQINEAMVMVFPPPPIRGVGRAGGFMLMVEDRGDVGSPALQAETERSGAVGQRERRSAAV